MGEMDTDTIGLIILIAAVLAVIVAGSGKRAKLRPMQRHRKLLSGNFTSTVATTSALTMDIE
jgi:hypothetical protein